MTAPGVFSASRASATDIPVGIVSVDLVGLKAQGYTRNQVFVQIDLRYMTGSVHVVPSTGDQWLCRWYGTSYILVSQLPINGTELGTLADNPQQGTVQIGSTNPNGQGPLHLNGSLVSANAPLNLGTYTTASRPDPTSVPDGTIIYNITTSSLESSNGVVWTEVGSGGGGGGVSGQSVFGEGLTGTKNGTNLSFTTTQDFVANSTMVFRNGLRELLNVTYTEVAPHTIHFNTAPLSDDVIIADYLGPTAASGTSIFGEIPTGTKNGTNLVFTLAHNFTPGSVAVYRNALRESNPANFTETTPNKITFVTAPLSSDDINVDYLAS